MWFVLGAPVRGEWGGDGCLTAGAFPLHLFPGVDLVLQGLPPFLAEQRDKARLGAALNRYGVNLNQIARYMNAGRERRPTSPP